MFFLHPLTADFLLLALSLLLLRHGKCQLHYRDVPYLFLRRRLLWGALSFVLHGAVLIAVMATLLTRYSPIWWLTAVLGSLPALLTLGYAVRVARHPRRVAGINKRSWKGAERVP